VGCLALDGCICDSEDCLELRELACTRSHSCGHPCGGVRGEERCLPCLQCTESGASSSSDKPLASADDYCTFCMYAISSEPAIMLGCKHVFHMRCVRRMLQQRWSGARIDFSFQCCPSCRTPMVHEMLAEYLAPINKLYEEVRKKALLRLEYEGLADAEELRQGGSFYERPADFAMSKFAYYMCYQCQKPYFGGGVQCDIGPDFDPSELVCGLCSNPGEMVTCNKHGDDYLEYKCRYCCSVAVWFCFGTTHFCNACHNRPEVGPDLARSNSLPHCPAGPLGAQLEGACPLAIEHPETGKEFALGCGLCRNAQSF